MTTGEPIPGRSPDQHNIIPPREAFEQEGISLFVPSRIKELPSTLGENIIINRDEKTDLILEQDPIRGYAQSRLSNAIKNGEKWALIYADGDHLKVANDQHDRSLGDLVIQYGAATIGNAVDQAQLGQDVEMIAMKSSSASDETIIWVFGLSDNELERLKSQVLNAQTPVTPKVYPNFTFSISAAILSSDDPQVQQDLANTRNWLLGDEQRVARNFFQQVVVGTTETEVKRIKMKKAYERVQELASKKLVKQPDINILIKAITEEMSGRRISEPELRFLLELTAAHSALWLANSKEARKKLSDLANTTQQEEPVIAKSLDELLKLGEEIFGFNV